MGFLTPPSYKLKGDENMKFEIKNKKLQDLLNYLKTDTLFPTCILTTKDKKLYSSQTEAYGYAFRFALFDTSFFKSITDENDSVKIDVEKTLKIIKTIDPEEDLIIQYPSPTSKNKLNIKGTIDDNNITVQTIEEGEAKEGLIFKMEKGIPILKAETDNPVKLDNKITLSLQSFKAIAEKATAYGTEFFSFIVDKKKNVVVRVGDLHDVSDFDNYKPKDATVQTNEEIEAVYTKGINEIAKTLTADKVELSIKSSCPVWISSVDKDYRLGYLLPPYVQEEESFEEEEQTD